MRKSQYTKLLIVLVGCGSPASTNTLGNRAEEKQISVEGLFDYQDEWSGDAEIASGPCAPPGPAWKRAEEALGEAIRKSLRISTKFEIRRSRDPVITKAAETITIEEIVARREAPFALVHVGRDGGYAIVTAEREAWFCIEVERGPSTIRLHPRRIRIIPWHTGTPPP